MVKLVPSRPKILALKELCARGSMDFVRGQHIQGLDSTLSSEGAGTTVETITITGNFQLFGTY
eukprot:6420066-Amphidinium_carterae.1